MNTLAIIFAVSLTSYIVGFYIARKTSPTLVPVTPGELAKALAATTPRCHDYVLTDMKMVVSVHTCSTARRAVVQQLVRDDLEAGVSLPDALQKHVGAEMQVVHINLSDLGEPPPPPDPDSIN